MFIALTTWAGNRQSKTAFFKPRYTADRCNIWEGRDVLILMSEEAIMTTEALGISGSLLQLKKKISLFCDCIDTNMDIIEDKSHFFLLSKIFRCSKNYPRP